MCGVDGDQDLWRAMDGTQESAKKTVRDGTQGSVKKKTARDGTQGPIRRRAVPTAGKDVNL